MNNTMQLQITLDREEADIISNQQMQPTPVHAVTTFLTQAIQLQIFQVPFTTTLA